MARDIDRIINERRTVNWANNVDVQNRMRNAIEDRLFELRDRHDIPLSLDDIDSVMERSLGVARVHKP